LDAVIKIQNHKIHR